MLSARVLAIIESEIKGRFEKRFSQRDSIMIFSMSKQCKITHYGYALNDDTDLIVL
jgi:CRISPR-associated protein Cas2